MGYVAAYRRRPAVGKEPRETTRRQLDFDILKEAEAWLAREMKVDDRAELGTVRRGSEVLAIFLPE